MRRAAVLLLPAIIVSFGGGASPAHAQGTVFNVLDFGAKGDGTTNDAAAIQATIAAASAAGAKVSCSGGSQPPQVLLPAGRTFLSGPLWLESCVDLHVETGATLLASPVVDDYPVVMKSSGFNSSVVGFVNGGRCVSNTSTQCTEWAPLRNVTLSGGGTIDGNGNVWWEASNWWPSITRPFLLDLFYIDDLVIRDLRLYRSAHWTVNPSLCRRVLIDNILVEAGNPRNSLPYTGFNIDGIDMNNVENLTLQNSVLHAGDDAIAINSRNCFLPGEWPTRGVVVRNVTSATPFSLGSGTGNGVYDVRIENCTMDPTVFADANVSAAWVPKWWRTAVRVKTARGRGDGPIANVVVSDLVVRDVDLVIDFQSYYSCQNSSGTANYLACRAATQLPPPPPGTPGPTFTNITVAGVRGSAWRVAWLNCLPERPCTGITFRDVQVSGNPLYPSSATGANGYVCENVYGSAVDVTPAADGCFIA
jgi:polygalacturonase